MSDHAMHRTERTECAEIPHRADIDDSLDSVSSHDVVRSAGVAKPTNREIVSASLRLLAMRDMSRIEFERKLAAKGFEAQSIAEAISWCIAEGWLNEARFAEVAARRLGHKYGAARIVQSLKQKGLSGSTLDDTMEAVKATEPQRAYAIWQRKFGEVTHNHDARAKQLRYLQSRGFSYAIANQIVRGLYEESVESASFA
jgi:regulatory protein